MLHHVILQIHPLGSTRAQLYEPAAVLSKEAVTWKDLKDVAVLHLDLFWVSPSQLACPVYSPVLPSPGSVAVQHVSCPWAAVWVLLSRNRNSVTSRVVTVTTSAGGSLEYTSQRK